MVSFPSVASTSTSTTTKVKKAKSATKEPKWRPHGRGGAGNLKRSKSTVPLVYFTEPMHVPRGREIPLPGSGVSYSGRGGAGNSNGHYLDPRVFERVLEYEHDLMQSVKPAEQVVKSGRGGIGNINPHKRTSVSQRNTLDDESTQSPVSPRSSTVMSISDNNPYMRKRSLSVGSTISASSAYTGMQHDQSPTSSTAVSSASHIPPNFLLGRRLRPTPSIESTSSDASMPSTANHHLSYLDDAQPTPRPMSPHRRVPSPPPTIATPNPLLRLRRGGSSPGTRRPPSGGTYIPLQTLGTLGTLRPPAAVPEEPGAADRDSFYDAASARLSLSEFPLPPPSPAEHAFAPPPSAPATQTSFSALGPSGSPPTRRAAFDLPQKPPPSGPLPVPPQLPPPSGPLPPLPTPNTLPSRPAAPARSASSDSTIRAPQPKPRPTLGGPISPPSSFFSAAAPSSPGLRPPPSPSGYFRRRPSTAPIPAPRGTSLLPFTSSPSSRRSEETLPIPMSPPPRLHMPMSPPPTVSGRMSVPPKGKVAPDKTAALVRALSLDTSIDGAQRSSLDMNDSESGSSAGDHSAPALLQPRSFFDNPLMDEPTSARSMSSSLPSSSRTLALSSPSSPPLSPASTASPRSSTDGKKRPGKAVDPAMRTKLALVAMRREHKAVNAMIFPRSVMGAGTLRL